MESPTRRLAPAQKKDSKSIIKQQFPAEERFTTKGNQVGQVLEK
jgi:hypothetical protein